MDKVNEYLKVSPQLQVTDSKYTNNKKVCAGNRTPTSYSEKW